MTRFENIRKSDRQAFDDLVTTYQQSLVFFASGILGNTEEAEDIVQDVFVDVWIKRKKINFGTQIRSFLYITTRFYCYNKLRAAKSLEAHLSKITAGEVPDPLDSMVEQEVLRILHSTIMSLPPRTAEVMKLTLRGLTQDEISKRLGIRITTVKSLKAVGIKKLKTIMDNIMVMAFF